ncbi:unnamed protein product [Chrysodeixis includens]|uniref:Uncharacterized protein n=1 Tax=Chrysodeixis includens TaxID=689277 RepID=A0A9N8PXH1_CHRIL|nr:unnamed protein product [Chrysodeixis includens]
MYTRAIAFLTTRIFDSFDATPPVTLATRRLVNSVFNSSSCLNNSFLSFVRNSEHLTLPILKTSGLAFLTYEKNNTLDGVADLAFHYFS